MESPTPGGFYTHLSYTMTLGRSVPPTVMSHSVRVGVPPGKEIPSGAKDLGSIWNENSFGFHEISFASKGLLKVDFLDRECVTGDPRVLGTAGPALRAQELAPVTTHSVPGLFLEVFVGGAGPGGHKQLPRDNSPGETNFQILLVTPLPS